MQRPIMKYRWITGGIAVLAALASAAVVAHAQPNDEDVPMAQNPPEDGPGGPNFRNMTPEQRRQFQEQMRVQMRNVNEQITRAVMNRAGFTDKDLQDAVIEYSNDNTQANEAVSEANLKLLKAVRDKADDAEISVLLQEFRIAIATETTRRAQAVTDLDAKIHYTQNLRLESLLAGVGLIGDVGSTSGNSMVGFMGRMMMGGVMDELENPVAPEPPGDEPVNPDVPVPDGAAPDNDPPMDEPPMDEPDANQ